MASSDALQLLRASIAVSKPPVLTTSSDPTTAEANQTDSFVEAVSLYFSHPTPLCLPLDQKTRFTSTNPDTVQVDLRSIFFAWLQKDVAVPEYIALAAELDKQLPDGQKVRNLIFVERLDLITWLEGASEESEYIKPVEGAAALGDIPNRAADVAGGAAVPTVGGAGVGVTQTVGGRPIKTIDARLQAIYNGERRLGDHNTALRGIKPTVRTQIFFYAIIANLLRTSHMCASTQKPSSDGVKVCHQLLGLARHPRHRNSPLDLLLDCPNQLQARCLRNVQIPSFSFHRLHPHYSECRTLKHSLTPAFTSHQTIPLSRRKPLLIFCTSLGLYTL